MYFFMFHAIPGDTVPEKDSIAGAYVRVHVVDNGNRDAAENTARELVEGAGWIIDSLEEGYPVTGEALREIDQDILYKLTEAPACMNFIYYTENSHEEASDTSRAWLGREGVFSFSLPEGIIPVEILKNHAETLRDKLFIESLRVFGFDPQQPVKRKLLKQLRKYFLNPGHKADSYLTWDIVMADLEQPGQLIPSSFFTAFVETGWIPLASVNYDKKTPEGLAQYAADIREMLDGTGVDIIEEENVRHEEIGPYSCVIYTCVYQKQDFPPKKTYIVCFDDDYTIYTEFFIFPQSAADQWEPIIRRIISTLNYAPE